MPKPFQEGATPSGPPKGTEKGVLSKQYPALWSWLCDATYEGGGVMGQTVVTLRRQGTMILATLRIEDQSGLKIEAVDVSPERALGSLEAVLSAVHVPWQVDRYPLGQPMSQRKKK